MSVARQTIRNNLIEVCGNSPMKRQILKAVKKPRSYKEVASEVQASPTNCSSALNEMAILGLVEPAGQKGFYRQTPIVRKMDIDGEIRKAGRKIPTVPSDDSTIRIVKVLDIEGGLDILDVDSELARECFPLKEPFMMRAGHAYLILENAIKKELGLPDTTYGIAVVAAAKEKGVFKRTVPSETDGLVQLFNSAFLWYRNIYHHKKQEMSKEEALKVIFHADYLIKLFRKQRELNAVLNDRASSSSSLGPDSKLTAAAGARPT